MSDELKAELVAKAKAAGIWNAQMSWSVETLERKIAEKAAEDPTEPPEAALEGEDEPEEDVEAEEVEEAAEEAPEEEAEDAPEPEAEPEPEQDIPEGDGVLCRITKKGADRVSNGQGGYFAWKDMVRLPIEIAGPLEDRGYVEIEE